MVDQSDEKIDKQQEEFKRITDKFSSNNIGEELVSIKSETLSLSEDTQVLK